MKTILSLSLAALTLAAAASAEEVTLTAPLQAGSLHTGALDMAAYRTDLADGGIEVTAAFRARSPSAEPQVVKMRLEDRDSVHFSLPFEKRTIYTFARTGGTVRISAEALPITLASK
ncbi:hypothetical protein LAZ29_10865 [Cereibacter sphaeroides]|uniref:hypothetical protein n=1 Tax=Cereibacter sphaeroides TaxID=1063 RepID=UPI001F3D48F8|nr:hypothetical protein [Cereibacter sphaeroides]MCE6951433.1 hypothetical protein [Cereibacter sphaeroides]